MPVRFHPERPVSAATDDRVRATPSPDEIARRLMRDDLIDDERTDDSRARLDECALMGALRGGEIMRVDDAVFIERDSGERLVEITSAPFQTESGVRGSVVVFTDMSPGEAEELRRRAQLDPCSWPHRVREALAQDRLELYAQPIVDVETGETVRHELLSRLVERDGTVVTAGEFVPAAEEHGLVVEIDCLAISLGARLAADSHPLQLNLSARSIAEPRVLRAFRDELERSGADPSLIVIELTETALMQDEGAAELFIDEVKALGCKLALDDFGSGYGGFTYLKRLPVDFLKIDQEFVRDLATDEASRHVVGAVVSLARGFGQQTIAEGVESQDTLRVLEQLGVDFAQGFAIARPMPVADVLGEREARPR